MCFSKEGAGVGEGGAPLFAATGNDPWGYPTTASWMGRGGSGGSRGFSGNSFGGNAGGFDRFSSGGSGGAGGESPTKPPAEGSASWSEGRGGSRRGSGMAPGGGRMNPFMKLIQSLFGF